LEEDQEVIEERLCTLEIQYLPDNTQRYVLHLVDDQDNQEPVWVGILCAEGEGICAPGNSFMAVPTCPDCIAIARMAATLRAERVISKP
jgi:hypothetical protein